MGSAGEAPNGEADLSGLGYTPIIKVPGEWSVEKVLGSIDDPPAVGSSSPLPFFHILERLKTTKREGWRRFGITR